MLSHKQLVSVGLFSSFLIFSAFAESALHYSVTHVADNDGLNIRAGAGVSNAVVAAIPFNGKDVQALGEEHAVGKTLWVKVKWKTYEGWVSKHYLQAEQTSKVKPIVAKAAVKPLEKSKVKPESELEPEVAKETKTKPQPSPVQVVEIDSEKPETVAENKAKVPIDYVDEQDIESEINAKTENVKKNNLLVGNWILQCGAKKPYWKVELHPKSLEVYRDEYEKSLPITLKKQHKNKWNTALKTVVKGKKGRDSLEMTIKYAYSKRCYDTLSSLVVPYKVTTVFNGETLTGCCHAVQLEEAPKQRQISKVP